LLSSWVQPLGQPAALTQSRSPPGRRRVARPWHNLADGYSAAANIFSSSAADNIGSPSIDLDGCPSTPTSGLPTSVTRSALRVTVRWRKVNSNPRSPASRKIRTFGGAATSSSYNAGAELLYVGKISTTPASSIRAAPRRLFFEPPQTIIARPIFQQQLRFVALHRNLARCKGRGRE
jgi:hypothetical protein